jgi:hypothetical protein
MRPLRASTGRTLLTMLTLLALACPSCSSSSGGSGGNGASAGPICSANTVELTGTIDGAQAKGTYTGPMAYDFVNALDGQPGTATFELGTGGSLNLSWMGLLADDQSASATGALTMPMEGPQAGQTYCVGGSITPRSQDEGDGISFTLSSLAQGVCPGTNVSGSLAGCASPAR